MSERPIRTRIDLDCYALESGASSSTAYGLLCQIPALRLTDWVKENGVPGHVSVYHKIITEDTDEPSAWLLSPPGNSLRQLNSMRIPHHFLFRPIETQRAECVRLWLEFAQRRLGLAGDRVDHLQSHLSHEPWEYVWSGPRRFFGRQIRGHVDIRFDCSKTMAMRVVLDDGDTIQVGNFPAGTSQGYLRAMAKNVKLRNSSTREFGLFAPVYNLPTAADLDTVMDVLATPPPFGWVDPDAFR